MSFNIGSDHGSQRNRLGKEGCVAICDALHHNVCLIQFLYLRGTSLGNNEVTELAEALKHYRYLHTLDLSRNWLEGEKGGQAIAKILERCPEEFGFVQLKKLDLDHNNLGNQGFEAILDQLKYERMRIETLRIASNNISMIQGALFEKELNIHVIAIDHLVLDNNHLKTGTYYKLSNLISMMIYLKTLSLKDCLINDSGLRMCFEFLPLLRRLQKVDFSQNVITDTGIQSIQHCIGDRYVKAGHKN